MIEKMKKVLFIGPDNTREAMLRDLQKRGIIQIEPYTGSAVEKHHVTVDTSRAERLGNVLKILKSNEGAEPLQQIEGASFETAEKIISLDRQLQQLREEEKSLNVKHDSISRWGTFSLQALKEIEDLCKIRIQFWETPTKGSAEIIAAGAHSLIVISQTAQNILFLSFSDNSITIDNCTESRIDSDTAKIEAQLIENRQNQSLIKRDLEELNRYSRSIKRLYFSEINEVNFTNALGSSVRPLGVLFAFQGWVPASKVKGVVDCAQNHNGKLFEIDPDKD